MGALTQPPQMPGEEVEAFQIRQAMFRQQIDRNIRRAAVDGVHHRRLAVVFVAVVG